MSGRFEPEAAEKDDAIISQMFWRSLRLFAVTLVIAVIGGGLWVYSSQQRPRPEFARQNQAPEKRQTATTIPELPFTDITQSSGITFHHINGATGQKLLPETMGSGCAFFDYDNDNDQDLLFVNSCSWPWDQAPAGPPPTMELYQNDGHGKFQNVTSESGLGQTFYGIN